jgi:hypothetical protein
MPYSDRQKAVLVPALKKLAELTTRHSLNSMAQLENMSPGVQLGLRPRVYSAPSARRRARGQRRRGGEAKFLKDFASFSRDDDFEE